MVKSEVLFLCLQIRIWARRTAIQLGQGDYALRVTGPVLQFFQSYYNISYPLSKSGRSRLNSSDLRMSQSKDNWTQHWVSNTHTHTLLVHRSNRSARLLLRCHGELGFGDVQRSEPSLRPADVVVGEQRDHSDHHRSRTRSHGWCSDCFTVHNDSSSCQWSELVSSLTWLHYSILEGRWSYW